MQPLDLPNAIRIAELLCTRLCHDLTGPIGAVNNGAEFLKEEGAHIQGQAVDLIVSSAGEAVSRLQFYRRAYGRINEEGEASLTDHKLACQEFFKGSKIALDWPDIHTDASGVSISRKMGKVILNLMIIASQVLIRGGTIGVRVEGSADAAVPDQEKRIILTAAGATVKWDKELEALLRGQMAITALTPKTVQPFITLKLTEEIGARLTWAVADNQAVLTVTQKINII